MLGGRHGRSSEPSHAARGWAVALRGTPGSARSPLAVIASATSLIVPPSALLTARMSSSGTRTASKRRRVPIGPLRLVWGAARSSSRTIMLKRRRVLVERVPRVQHAVGAHLGGVEDRLGRAVQPLPGARQARQAGPIARGSCRRAGLDSSPAARVLSTWRLVSAALAVTSSSRWPTSTEPTPSTMQWCVFVASAQRPSASPSTIAISHSGRRRSRRWEKKPEAHSCSSLSPPGAGRAARPTCRGDRSRGRLPFAARTCPRCGAPKAAGGSAEAGRGGTPGDGRAPRATAPRVGTGSNTMTPPMCMCALSSACSSSRNVASRGVR